MVGDCISREAVLEKMADYVASGYADSAEDFEEYSRIICQLPPVTPQPKTGYWIDCDNSEDYSADGYDCSVCGVNAEYATNYCPHCGAKMESEEV